MTTLWQELDEESRRAMALLESSLEQQWLARVRDAQAKLVQEESRH